MRKLRGLRVVKLEVDSITLKMVIALANGSHVKLAFPNGLSSITHQVLSGQSSKTLVWSYLRTSRYPKSIRSKRGMKLGYYKYLMILQLQLKYWWPEYVCTRACLLLFSVMLKIWDSIRWKTGTTLHRSRIFSPSTTVIFHPLFPRSYFCLFSLYKKFKIRCKRRVIVTV